MGQSLVLGSVSLDLSGSQHVWMADAVLRAGSLIALQSAISMAGSGDMPLSRVWVQAQLAVSYLWRFSLLTGRVGRCLCGVAWRDGLVSDKDVHGGHMWQLLKGGCPWPFENAWLR